MSGNGREWVADWYDESYYRHARQRNPKGPSGSGLGRVVRGGSWRYDRKPKNFRAANRGWYPPGNGHSSVGFRCAKAP
jgi:formylglycine-generating enzyme required for sulfatase activity